MISLLISIACSFTIFYLVKSKTPKLEGTGDLRRKVAERLAGRDFVLQALSVILVSLSVNLMTSCLEDPVPGAAQDAAAQHPQPGGQQNSDQIKATATAPPESSMAQLSKAENASALSKLIEAGKEFFVSESKTMLSRYGRLLLVAYSLLGFLWLFRASFLLNAHRSRHSGKILSAIIDDLSKCDDDLSRIRACHHAGISTVVIICLLSAMRVFSL